MTVNDIRFYKITEPENLRSLCIKHNYFTCGTGRQYDKLFFMNEKQEGFSLEEIALLIWACSDTGAEVESLYEIEETLEKAQDEYMSLLESIVRDSQETA